MTSLTGAPSWTDAWRSMFEKGDVVGIKVSPVGGKNLCSDATVMHNILDGLKEAGIPANDVDRVQSLSPGDLRSGYRQVDSLRRAFRIRKRKVRRRAARHGGLR